MSTKPEKRVDRRVRYTKMVIRESFISLLSEKPISKITVKEICEGADINRATFYAHFADPYDLLAQIEDDFTEKISAYVGTSFDVLEGEEPLRALTKIFEYVGENAELCMVLFNRNGDANFLDNMMQIIGRNFVGSWTQSRDITRARAEYIFNFAIGGGLAIIGKWLENGRRETPAEMAELLLTVAAKGSLAYI